MKRILFLFAIIFSIASSAQLVTPVTGTYASFSQLWNPSSFYYNTVTAASQLGAQLDTVTNTGTIYLESSNLFFNTAGPGNPAIYTITGNTKGISASVNSDTVVVQPIPGWGQITLTASILKCTGTPTVTVTPISSSDGVHWVAIPGSTAGSTLAVTVAPTSLTVALATKWIFLTKPDKYVGVSVTGSGSSTVSAYASVYFLKPYVAGSSN